MNKQEFVKKIAVDLGLTQAKAAEVIRHVLDTAVSAAASDGRTVFKGHRFVRKNYDARQGRNPKTGAAITIPAKTVVQYKAVV